MDTSLQFCTSCGAPLTPGVRFCESCGTPVAVQAQPIEVPQPQAAPPPATYQPTQSQPPAAPPPAAYRPVPPRPAVPPPTAYRPAPPQPPRRRNTGLIIGLVVGGVALCCVVLAVILVVTGAVAIPFFTAQQPVTIQEPVEIIPQETAEG